MAAESTIPEKMKRLVVKESGATVKDCKIEIETDVEVPKLLKDQVLVKMVAAAINPSDYGKWKKVTPEQSPFVMGNEGCGTVVALGGGLVTKRFKIGAKVGVVGPKGKQGTYSEYVAMSATDGVFPMPETLPTEEAASFFVNPYTALGMLETGKSLGSKAVVHTAAASQVGQMMVKLAKQEGMQVINVVRREEQAKLLKDLGAEHVVVTAEENWKETLKTKIDTLKATVAFDAVAGEGAGDILALLPNKGTYFIYGGLGGNAGNINPTELIYNRKTMKGWFLVDWVSYGGNPFMGVPRMLMAGKKVNDGLANGWSKTQFKDTTLEKAQEDIVQLLESKATGQKLRIRFDVV